MDHEPEQRQITHGNFVLAVVARPANVARRPTLLTLLRRFWVVLAGGSMLVLAVALMWPSPITNEPLSPAMAKLCSVHRNLAARSPYSRPITIYETLGLDPSKKPFYPADLSTLNGNAEAINRLVLNAYAKHGTTLLQRHNTCRRDARFPRRDDYWVLRRQGTSLLPDELDEEWNDILVKAASIISTYELRELYDRVFMPVLSQYAVMQSEEAVSKTKRVKLADLCHWKEKKPRKP